MNDIVFEIGEAISEEDAVVFRILNNKYGAKRTIVDGQSFPSGLEASVYSILVMMQKSGEIRDLVRYPSVRLVGKIKWQVDFSYWDLKILETTWVEAKGMETADYRIKKELWRCGFGPGPLQIWKGTARKPIHVETVLPADMENQ